MERFQSAGMAASTQHTPLSTEWQMALLAMVQHSINNKESSTSVIPTCLLLLEAFLHS
jgi:hypothetical protein